MAAEFELYGVAALESVALGALQSPAILWS